MIIKVIRIIETIRIIEKIVIFFFGKKKISLITIRNNDINKMSIMLLFNRRSFIMKIFKIYIQKTIMKHINLMNFKTRNSILFRIILSIMSMSMMNY